MIRNPKRVHIDFHTSEHIKDVAARFDARIFADMLKSSHVDAVTLFAKCHHGNFYYYGSRFHVHPHLKQDLLPMQLEACKKAGIQTFVYISAGVDQYNALRHKDWLVMRSYEDQVNGNYSYGAYYSLLCFNSPYLDELCEQTKEVVSRFMPDGIFLDIISEQECFCASCLRSMKEKGLDYAKEEDRKKHARMVLATYYRRINEAARSVKPDIEIFHNSGNIPRGRTDMMEVNSRFELESLPTGIWGYDHFPASLTYLRHKGKDCIGMTGKFHGTWGDFGSYKYFDALKYEACQSLALGAGICVGDQMHPAGILDEYTYRNIANAFSYYELLEKYNTGAFYAEVGVLSQDIVKNEFIQQGDTGACRILLEEKILFDVIDVSDISDRYKVIILPDTVELDDNSYGALRRYVDSGGKLLASGRSGLYNGRFAFDLGAKFVGRDELQPAYFVPRYQAGRFKDEPLVIYEASYAAESTGSVLSDKLLPYFNRTEEHFCSHMQTPCDYSRRYVGITEGAHGIWIGAEIFTDYAKSGSMNDKQLVAPLLDRLLGGRTVTTNLPSQAKVSLLETEEGTVMHAFFANTIKRGSGVEVIEDIVPLERIKVSLNLGREAHKVTLLPQNVDIPYENGNGTVAFTIPEMKIHQAVKII